VLRLNHITFACEDPKRVCEFWADLLEYRGERGGEDWFARGDGPELRFAPMPKSPTIELPIHLDVNVPDREEELRRLLTAGASLVETRSHSVGDLEETWTVMRDPEGNGFCLQTPRNPPPGRYLGNVTFSCAEPVELGRFWVHALGWPEEPIDEAFLQQLRDAGIGEHELTGFYVIRESPTSRPRLLFQRRERSRPASYPIHLDFLAEDREGEIDRLTAAGAQVEQTRTEGDRRWMVLRDPDGNPFCVE